MDERVNLVAVGPRATVVMTAVNAAVFVPSFGAAE
jgi:hypothetical protein